MELLQGASLSRVVASEGPLGPARAVHIARKVAEALGAAHQAGIIHRDLKPDNIHIGASDSGRGIIKVLDFGLAKIAGSSNLTRAGMVFGTPHYMSPEQASGEPVDHRADIYALGVVLFEMLAGRVPFESDTYMGVLTKHLYVDPPRPSDVADGDPLGDLEGVVMRCLAKNPEMRYESMSELLDALDAASPASAPSSSPVGSLSAASALVTGAGVPRRVVGWLPWPLLVGAMGLTGAGAVGVWWWIQGSEPGERETESSVPSPKRSPAAESPAGDSSHNVAPTPGESDRTGAVQDAGQGNPLDSQSSASATQPNTSDETKTTNAHDGRRRGRKQGNRKSLSTRRRPASVTGDIIDPWAR
jgi:serine/threonine-protein kinase